MYTYLLIFITFIIDESFYLFRCLCVRQFVYFQQKTVKSLVSQLTAATNEDFKINKLFQEANKQLHLDKEKNKSTINDLSIEIDQYKRKLKEMKGQKENSRILEAEQKLKNAEQDIDILNRRNDDTKKKLQKAEQDNEILKRQKDDTERKLQNAEQVNEILKRQKDDTEKKLQNAEQDNEVLQRQKDETERDYLNTIQDLTNKLPEFSVDCSVDHHKQLEDQVKHLTIENSELRDRVDTLIKEKSSLHENIRTLEQEKNTFKQQIDSWIAKKHSTGKLIFLFKFKI